MKNILYLAPLIAALALSSGCSTRAPVMPMGNGAYTVSITGTTGFTPLGKLRKRAYKEANRYAEDHGKLAEVISANEVPQGFGRFPEVEVRFRLVETISETESAPTLKISNTATYDAMGKRRDAETKIVSDPTMDVYQKINALGELREKGLLTEEEFQREKAKLLKQ